MRILAMVRGEREDGIQNEACSIALKWSVEELARKELPCPSSTKVRLVVVVGLVHEDPSSLRPKGTKSKSTIHRNGVLAKGDTNY